MRQTLLLLLVAIAGASKAKLPSCNSARTAYKKGELYAVLGVPKSATQKEIKKYVPLTENLQPSR
jgi:hypothetical protein